MGGCTLPWTIILHEPSAPSSCMQPWWGKSWFLFSNRCRNQGEAQTSSPAVFPWTPWVWQPLDPCCSTLLPLPWMPLAAERSLSWTNKLYTSILFCRRVYNLFWGDNSSESLDFSAAVLYHIFLQYVFFLITTPLTGLCLVLHIQLHHCAPGEQYHFHFSPSLLKTLYRLHVSGSQRDYLAERTFHLFPLCHLQM